MAITVSETFRENCYDMSKKQRLVLRSGDLSLSNEDISVNGGVKFNLASITSTQQVQFGCTPCNTISVSILNQDGRIEANSLTGREFYCSIGVETSTADYLSPKNAISAIDTGVDMISVHSEAPYIRGNCTFGSVLPQLMLGAKCKIMYSYDVVFFVVDSEGTRYYAKHDRTGLHQFGEYEIPSSSEQAVLDRIMDDCDYDAVAYFDGGMIEYTYDHDEGDIPGEWATASGSIVYITDALAYSMASWVIGLGQAPGEPYVPSSDFFTWSAVKTGTWGEVKNNTWGELSGYSVFKTVRYEAVPYGVWHFDRPRRVNSAVLTLNGKDRMVAFDEDSADFASDAPNTLITVREMIVAIANYKGVPVGNLDGLNELVDEIMVNPSVYYQNKSLKDLLSYLFEVGGANCMIDREGNLCASSADNDGVELPYVYLFDVADYTAHTVKDMMIYREGEYTQYQTDEELEDGVRYDWNDNPFFNNIVLSGSWFSQGVNRKYGDFRNAITITDADFSLWCDDVYLWTDEDEVTYREPIFSMTVEWNGNGIVSYTNYGEEERTYSSYNSRTQGVTNQTDKNLQGFNKAQRADRLYFDENGLTVQSRGLVIKNDNDENVFYADNEGNLTLEGNVKAHSGNVGGWEIVEDGLLYNLVDSDGRLNQLALVPKVYGNMVSISSPAYKCEYEDDGMWFYYSDNNGGYNFGAIINYEKDDDPYYAWLEIRCGMGGSTADNNISLEAKNVHFYASKLIYHDPPTTASAANVALVNDAFYKVSSLEALKDNIQTIENASEKVDNLRGVTFTSKCEADDPNKVYYGLIAEEVEQAVPELATYEDGKLQSVQYDRVCALLIEDLKACHRRIEELEKRVNDLESRLK